MGIARAACTAVEEALRIHPTWINGGCELPGQGGSVIAAMLAVAARPVPPRAVLPHGLGVDVRRRSSARRRAAAAGGGRVGGDMQWRAPFGAMSAANWIGMNASTSTSHRYGTTRELLGRIALNGRANAARNPAADLPRPDDDGRLPRRPA